MHNLFTDLPSCSKQSESFETLLSCRNVTIERIVSASFCEGEWMTQAHDEWVVLLQGEAELEFSHQHMMLQSGDYLFIPALTSHRVVKTSKQALWLTVHINAPSDHPV